MLTNSKTSSNGVYGAAGECIEQRCDGSVLSFEVSFTNERVSKRILQLLVCRRTFVTRSLRECRSTHDLGYDSRLPKKEQRKNKEREWGNTTEIRVSSRFLSAAFRR